MSLAVETDASPLEGIPALLTPRPWRVVEKLDEGPDIVTLHVEPTDGLLPVFRPAQCSMLGAFGVGEAPISISSTTDNHDFHGYTIRRAGAITNALVETPVGGIITVRGPFGNEWPLDDIDTGNVLIAAGGLGIVPLRAAVHEIVARPDEYDRIAMVYGVRTPADFIFEQDLAEWEAGGVHTALTVDVGDAEWKGAVGVAPSLLGVEHGLRLDWADTSALVCGPDAMMRFTADALIALGVHPDRIWLTLERNMQCGNALCGHCQLGPFIVCRDGPVANYAQIAPFLRIPEL